MDQRDDKTKGRIRGRARAIGVMARGLREAMTPAERVLWQALRRKQLNGLRFRSQHAVGPFILDFYCPSCKLAIELDGAIHDGRADQDAARTQYLNGFGYRVLRFENEQVLTDLPSVLEEIVQAARVATSIEEPVAEEGTPRIGGRGA